MKSTVLNVVTLLTELHWKIVFAESCTGGAITAELAQVPGVSDHLCGAFVVYRMESKQRWLGIPSKLLKLERGVGDRTAQALARSALKRTPEAHLSVAVTGHLGPNAPQKLDGKIFGAIALRQRKRRTSEVQIFSFQFVLPQKDRVARQRMASLSILKMVRSLLTRVATHEKSF